MVSKAAKEARPIRMACLDVALNNLSDKDALFALGVDLPLIFRFILHMQSLLLRAVHLSM